MFEAFSIAVKLKLIDGVTGSLSVIARGMKAFGGDADTAQKHLAEVEMRLRGIKQLGLVGGAMAGAGVFGLSLLEAPIKAAREYELAFTKFKTLNLGDAVNKQADQFARSANLMGVSAKELMHTMAESVGLFGGYETAQKLAPKLAALNQANSAIFGGKISGIDEGGSRALMKFIDRRGGTHDETTFMRNLDLAQKLVTGSGGFIKFRDLDQFSQQGGTAFRGLSDAGILNMSLLLQEQGGARAGTSFMSLYQNLIAGRTPKKTMAMLQEFGLGHLGMEEHATVGGKSFMSLVMRDIKEGALLQANPTEWFRGVFLPALASKGITDEAGILKITNDLLSNRSGSAQGSIMSTQLLQIARDANLGKGAMGYEQTIAAWKNDPNSKFADLTARWTDTLRELGSTVLPLVIQGVEGLTSGLKSVIHFAQTFPTLTKGMVSMFGVLAVAAAAGGTLTLATAGFKALGLAIGMGASGGGLFAAIAPLIGAGGSIAVLVAGIVALGVAASSVGWLADKLSPGKKDDGKPHPNEHWVPGHGRNGVGGYWEANRHSLGRGLGEEVWDGSRFVKAPSGAVQVTTNIHLDKRQIGQAVTAHQAREASKPQSGISGFDSNIMPMPVGAR